MVRWFIRVGLVYPWGWLGTVYAVWLLAWAGLGRRPRPLLDDPKTLGVWVDLAHTASIYVFLLALPILFASLTAALSLRFIEKAPWRTALLWLAALQLSWIVAVGFARIDPGHVIAWYLD
jgi:hypothetical protein